PRPSRSMGRRQPAGGGSAARLRDGREDPERDVQVSRLYQPGVDMAARRFWMSYKPDFATALAPAKDYLTASRRLELPGRRKARWVQAVIYTMLLGMIADLVAYMNQAIIKEQYQWRVVIGPSVLTAEQEKAAKPGSDFKECANGCPTMIVVPAGKFRMGAP